MFADDLVNLSRASRLVAKACKTCLNIYIDLTGKNPSVSKSTAGFSCWANKKVCRARVLNWS